MYDQFEDDRMYVAGELPEDVKKFYTVWVMAGDYTAKGCPSPLSGVLFWNRGWTDAEKKMVESNDLYFLEYEMRTIKTYTGMRYFFFEGTSNDPKDTTVVTVIGVKPNGEFEEPWEEENFEGLAGYSIADLERAVAIKTFDFSDDVMSYKG